MVHIQKGWGSIGAWRRNTILRSRVIHGEQKSVASIEYRGWPYTPDGSHELLELFDLADMAEEMTTREEACAESELMLAYDKRRSLNSKTWLKDCISRWREINDADE